MYFDRNLSIKHQNMGSKQIFLHYHPQNPWSSKNPTHCISYNPPAPSLLRKKGVRENNANNIDILTI